MGGAPTPDPPSPMVERRKKPMVHPAAPAPLPKDYGETPPPTLRPPQLITGVPRGPHRDTSKKKKSWGRGDAGRGPKWRFSDG